ncbi:ion transporter [Desulfonema ishimotonii]|uniref:Ion transporter n=1 Tax=Desulfonema ishimotonii TaxID=45657 RepID=A0A401G377_9BACT|nr:potassium channel family protein [Desulfonema ishimotonii]GBC63643.1 ion transporter [Desulfonema ishimotonii]
MSQNDSPPILENPFRGRFLFLIISMLLLLILSPFLQGIWGMRLIVDIFFAATLLSAVYAVHEEKKHTLINAFLAIPMLISLVLRHLIEEQGFFITMVGNFFGTLLILFTLFSVLSFVYRQTEVTRDVLHAAIVVYLLFGLMWSILYSILEGIEPGSFKLGDSLISDRRVVFLYYSFVTLTTLGYGDITPLTSKASALSIVEAIIGQLYLVIQVAWLVGMYTSRSLDKRTRQIAAKNRPRSTGSRRSYK